MIKTLKTPQLAILIIVNIILAHFVFKLIQNHAVYWKYVQQTHAKLKPPYEIPTSEILYREYTLDELKVYNGRDDKHILVSIHNQIYDVTSAPHLYGTGKSYSALAGREATHCLVINKIIPVPEETIQKFDAFLWLTGEERDVLSNWLDFFDRKYPRVGTVIHEHRWVGSDQEDGMVDLVRGALLPDLEIPSQ